MEALSPIGFMVEYEEKCCQDLNRFLTKKKQFIMENEFVFYNCETSQQAKLVAHLLNHYGWTAHEELFTNNEWCVIITKAKYIEKCECALPMYLKLFTLQDIQKMYLDEIDDLLNQCMKQHATDIYDFATIQIKNLSAGYVEILLTKLRLWNATVEQDEQNLFTLCFSLED